MRLPGYLTAQLDRLAGIPRPSDRSRRASSLQLPVIAPKADMWEAEIAPASEPKKVGKIIDEEGDPTTGALHIPSRRTSVIHLPAVAAAQAKAEVETQGVGAGTVEEPEKVEEGGTKILMYPTLISFLKTACSAKVSGRSPGEIANLQQILDGYLLSMSSSSVVGALVHGLESQTQLLKLCSELGLTNDPNLRHALRADEEQIITHIMSIFDSKAIENDVLSLKGDSAQHVLDVVQDALDRGFLMAQEHSRKARRLIRKLSESCDKLPSSLFITDVTSREEHPLFGGGFGDIYRASYGDKTVALKCMRHFYRGSELRDIRMKICREALIWKDLQHPHILTFIGIDRESFPFSLCIVSPWMEHGTILNYLKLHGRANVDKLLFEIAQGLEYLHSRNIVHGDLRGANILINEDWSACLADFGLSNFMNPTSSMRTSNRAGSLYWMAPELIDPDRFGLKFLRTPATDVYAFGCVCVEADLPFQVCLNPQHCLELSMGNEQSDPSTSCQTHFGDMSQNTGHKILQPGLLLGSSCKT
ncbi:kinase-like domain-containing protein [Mycena epipterygia]|nr:kinase-like domain-containing protein [Mycena epipterygia]